MMDDFYNKQKNNSLLNNKNISNKNTLNNNNYSNYYDIQQQNQTNPIKYNNKNENISANEKIEQNFFSNNNYNTNQNNLKNNNKIPTQSQLNLPTNNFINIPQVINQNINAHPSELHSTHKNPFMINSNQNQYQNLQQTSSINFSTQQNIEIPDLNNNLFNNNNNQHLQIKPNQNQFNGINDNCCFVNPVIPIVQAVEEDKDGKHICIVITLTLFFGFFAGFYFCYNFSKIKRKNLVVGVFLFMCFLNVMTGILLKLGLFLILEEKQKYE